MNRTAAAQHNSNDKLIMSLALLTGGLAATANALTANTQYTLPMIASTALASLYLSDPDALKAEIKRPGTALIETFKDLKGFVAAGFSSKEIEATDTPSDKTDTITVILEGDLPASYGRTRKMKQKVNDVMERCHTVIRRDAESTQLIEERTVTVICRKDKSGNFSVKCPTKNIEIKSIPESFMRPVCELLRKSDRLASLSMTSSGFALTTTDGTEYFGKTEKDLENITPELSASALKNRTAF